MNGLLIATLVFGGGSAIAMQNDDIHTKVDEQTSKVMYQVKNMFKGTRIDNIRENGLSYPSDEFLSTLTEEQAFQVISAIDVINATYDWANMTDEEIMSALVQVKADMSALYTDLGIDGPYSEMQTRSRKGKHWNEDFVPGSGNRQHAPGTVTDEVQPDADDIV